MGQVSPISRPLGKIGDPKQTGTWLDDLFARLFNASASGVLVVAAGGGIRFANNAFASMLGLAREVGPECGEEFFALGCLDGGTSIVAVGLFHALVTLLGLDAEGGDGAGFQSAQADGLAGLLAKAVGTGLDAH